MSNVITSVWSSYGHRFMSGTEYDEQGQGDEPCLTCGAVFRLQLVGNPDSLTEGEYVTNSGGQPRYCTGDTGQVHGYPGERACMNPECDHSEGPCSHETHECNCLQCD